MRKSEYFFKRKMIFAIRRAIIMGKLFGKAVLKQQFTQLPYRQQLEHQHQKTKQRECFF